MSATNGTGERWAIVLAGGDGRRLEEHTRQTFGEARPKQFCTFGGGESLLAGTVRRALALVNEDRVLVVIQQAHRALAEEALAAFPTARLVAQPRNRDTLPGLTLPLLRIFDEDPGALIYVLPADHHVVDGPGFATALVAAADRVVAEPGTVAVLGAHPRGPEEGFGWLVPCAGCEGSFSAVSAFREKPGGAELGALLKLGASINTFVLVARAAKLLRLVAMNRPDWFEALFASYADEEALVRAYEVLGPANFSHEVLERCVCCLRLAPLGDVGWTDIGTPERLELAFGPGPPVRGPPATRPPQPAVP